ncbi:MAG: pyrroline-5-carboxylate reductase [Bacteroidia bacterium]|nr:pyrroline-5-carboxylate reductase [Bacteroidia bacterium]
MKVTIAGCGNMGLIYARAFLKYNIVERSRLYLAEKSRERKEILKEAGLGLVTTVNDPEVGRSDIIIIAVKPQDFDALADELRPVLRDGQIIISIMAGIRIPTLQKELRQARVVRAMPNSPAEIGMGMTGYSCSREMTMDETKKAENLLGTTGRTIYFEDEEMLNSVTGVSGSGPAYFFYIVRAMIEAGKRMGLDEHIAGNLVKQTMLGSFHLLNTSGKSLDELIRAVMSRGGTTEAAFRCFEEQGVGEGLSAGMQKARERAAELAR